MKKLIRWLDKIDLILDTNRPSGCPTCGNYRLKFDNEWQCPQSSFFCGIWDRLGKKKIKDKWLK